MVIAQIHFITSGLMKHEHSYCSTVSYNGLKMPREFGPLFAMDLSVLHRVGCEARQICTTPLSHITTLLIDRFDPSITMASNKVSPNPLDKTPPPPHFGDTPVKVSQDIVSTTRGLEYMSTDTIVTTISP